MIQSVIRKGISVEDSTFEKESEVREEKYFRLLDAAVTAGMRRSEQMEAAETT